MDSRTLSFGKLRITNISDEDLLFTLYENLESHSRCWVAYGDASGVIIASSNLKYWTSLKYFDIIFPAGHGICIASKVLGYVMPKLYQGTDLLPKIFDLKFDRSIKVFLFGSRLKTLELVRKKIENSPTFEVVGFADGYSDFEDSQSILEKINQTNPDLLLIGMGVSKQEQWVADNYRVLNVPVIVCVGNFFEFLAGTIPRAPIWMRKIGLEWFHRLLHEPRRLFTRYVFGIPKFLWIVFKQKFSTL